jgi:DNA primase
MGASLDFNGLPNYLKQKGYTYEEMVASGAVGEKNGRYYDFLGGRLIIPVIDQFNNVVALDGRRIDGIKEQKYINTKETQVFFKGKTLFNINNLKKVKNEEGIDGVIIVEGHLDVVSLSQAGFRNVVATMGTAMTKDQARILKRYSDKIIVSYDGDSAGRNATMRGLEILEEEGLDVKVISLPEGMDPDDVIREKGADAYRQLLLEAKPLVDFKIDVLKKAYDVKTVDGKRKFATNALKVIRESSSATEQEDLLKTVRDITGTSFEALKRELYSEPEKKPEIRTESSPEFNDNTGGKEVMAARFILYSYLFNKQYAYETDVRTLTFEQPVHKEIQRYLTDKINAGEKAKFNELYEELADDGADELSKIAGLQTDERKYDEATYLYDCLRTLRKDVISKQIDRLNKMFSQESDNEKRREIAKQLSELLTKKNKGI